MKRQIQFAAAALVCCLGGTNALADGTYVYGDGSVKDYSLAVPVPAPAPVPMREASWYLRGNVGGSFTGALDTSLVGIGNVSLRGSSDIPTTIFGEIGVGYYIKPHIRTEFTSSFHQIGELSNAGVLFSRNTTNSPGAVVGTNTNHYNEFRNDNITVRQRSTNLLNFYYDIANETRFTPYIGAGFGVTYRNIETRSSYTANCFRVVNSVTGVVPGGCAGLNRNGSRSEENQEWLFTGALMTGFSYDVNDYITLDAGYRVVWTPGESSSTLPSLGGGTRAEWSNELLHQFRTGIRLNIF